MAKLEPTSYPLPDLTWPDMSAHEDAFAALQESSDALPEGEIVGHLYRSQYADGYAYYLVTKASPLTLQHVPYGDAWNLPAAHVRGLNVADIREHQRRDRAMTRLFSSKGN